MATLVSREKDFLSTLNRSPATRETYRNALMQFRGIVGPGAALDADSFIAFLKAISNLSPSTQRVYRTAVLRLYDFCDAGHERELRKAVEHYTAKQKESFPNPDIDAIAKLVVYCEAQRNSLLDFRDRAFVILLVDTGLRISEACKLNRGDIDWRRDRTVVVGKGRKQALVRLSERSILALKDYLAARQKLDGATGKPLASLPLFARHDRGAGKNLKRVAAGGMWFAIKDRMTEAGIDKSTVRIHDLRHYFVTTILQASGNLKMAQELARHESVQVTQRYAHLSNETLDRGYHEIFNRPK